MPFLPVAATLLRAAAPAVARGMISSLASSPAMRQGPDAQTPGEPGEVQKKKELADLRGLMADKNSEYWAGPNAEKNQARYRELVTELSPAGGP